MTIHPKNSKLLISRPLSELFSNMSGNFLYVVWAVRRADGPDYNAAGIEMKGYSSQAVFDSDILVEECQVQYREDRFQNLLRVVCESMNNLALFAYTCSGHVRLRQDM